ncbi:MAG: LysM peptidoglycan-binding domain-containing protein [Propionibacterium sp.]|nr:LysM peptidoglycan-binding domain-containing protein [Propionibacterium sp.]
MNPTHAPTPTRRTRTTGDVARALAAILALAGFVAGVPAALVVVAPLGWPRTWPTWDTVLTALTRPDDGTLFLGAVTLVAWGAWAAFTLSVLTELAAAARHITVPSVPLLGLTQRAAATLITTAGLLVVTSAPLLGTPTAHAAVLVDTAPQRPIRSAQSAVAMTASDATTMEASASIAPSMTALSPAAPVDRHPVITVARGDTLWSLAERHLGNGARYTEIRDLNLGQPQPDGRTLTETHWIYPGWQLRLPFDATALPAPATTANSTATPIAAATSSYDVTEGESLWGIAAQQLGDGARYREIYDLSTHTLQSDGRTLTDPDVIRPGWHLTIPSAAGTPSAAPTPAAVPAQHPAPSAPQTLSTAPRAEPTSPAGLVEPRSLRPAGAEQDDQVGSGAPGRGVNDETVTVGGANSKTDDETAERPFAQDFYLGLSALAAAGVIGELSRRRHLQHRRRRVGQRIALPQPGSQQDAAERDLRSAICPLTIPQIKAALLTLASRSYAAERDLPRVGAILLTETTLELHLTVDDDTPVAPFTSTSPRTWSAPIDAIAADPTIDDDADRPEPYPALVTLGHTDDAVVFVNLEAAGTLTLTGEPEVAGDTLRAVVAELATSDLTGRIGLIAGEAFAGLAGVCDPARLQIVADPGAVHDQIASRDIEVASALGGIGADDTLQARSDRAVGDVWLPVVYVATNGAETAYQRCAPWSGTAVIGAGTSNGGGWSLVVDDDASAVLEPLGLRMRPQRLSRGDLDTLVSMLRTADGPHRSSDLDVRAAPRPLVNDIADALAALPPRPAPDPPDPAQGLEGSPQAVRVNVLGPIQIDGIPHGSATRLSKRGTELVVYLALRRSANGPELVEALWHGKRVDNQARNSLIYRTRQHLGEANLPVVDADGTYRLGPDVISDWTEFQRLARAGLSAGTSGAADLQAALDLVRSRPLLGTRDSDYAWAENDIQHMIETITDVAHVLSQLRLGTGDHRAAIEAATKGLLVEPCSDLLHRDAVSAAFAHGDDAEADRLIARHRALLAELDPDFDDETLDSSAFSQ